MGNVFAWNNLLAIIQCFQGFIIFAFFNELAGNLYEHTAVCLCHTHDGFIQINVIFVDAAKFKFMHQVVIHFFAVQSSIQLGCVEWGYAICQTFLHKVVAQIQMIFTSYGNSHVYWTFPISVSKHFQHHQLMFVEYSFSFQRNMHVFRDFSVESFRNHHAGTLDSFLVQFKNNTICWN